MEKRLLTRIENYIFDLDGTLINTADFILKSLKMALDEMELSVDCSKMHKGIIGPPLDVMIKNLGYGFDDATIGKIVQKVRSIQLTLPASDYPNFMGILPTLELLKSKGKKLFVATNRSVHSTISILKENGLYNLFDDVYIPDKYADKRLSKSQMIQEVTKEHGLEKSATIMVGDTEEDQKGAENAGCGFIGVSWGYAADKHKFEQVSDLYVTNIEQIIF